MLNSSRNIITSTSRNNVLLDIWPSLSSVKLIHSINCQYWLIQLKNRTKLISTRLPPPNSTLACPQLFSDIIGYKHRQFIIPIELLPLIFVSALLFSIIFSPYALSDNEDETWYSKGVMSLFVYRNIWIRSGSHASWISSHTQGNGVIKIIGKVRSLAKVTLTTKNICSNTDIMTVLLVT